MFTRRTEGEAAVEYHGRTPSFSMDPDTVFVKNVPTPMRSGARDVVPGASYSQLAVVGTMPMPAADWTWALP